MIYSKHWILAVSILSVLCTSCGSSSTDERRLCDAQIRKSIVDIQSVTSRKDPSGVKFEAYRENIRTILDRCTVSSDGVAITGNTSVSKLEIYVMAELNEELQSRLDLVESMDDSKKASLLFVAARYGDLEILRNLVQSGVDATLTDSLGNNAISETVDSPVFAEEKIELLFHAGVDPLAKSAHNFSALDGAVLAEDFDVIKKILSIVSSSNEGSQNSVADTLELARKLESPAQELLENWLAPL